MKKKIIFFLLCLSVVGLFAGTKDKNAREKGFQFGIGGTVASGNFLALSNIVNMADNDYWDNYSVDGAALPENLKRTLRIANIFETFEYSIRIRFMWNFFLLQSDFLVCPMDSVSSGRLDVSVTSCAGFRVPFVVQPYILAGAQMNFSFYPDRISQLESWKLKADYGVVDHFCFRPGVTAETGLDIKLEHFSIGFFYKYAIKDFNEFTDWYNILEKEDSDSAVLKLVGAQSRVGICMMFYL